MTKEQDVLRMVPYYEARVDAGASLLVRTEKSDGDQELLYDGLA